MLRISRVLICIIVMLFFVFQPSFTKATPIAPDGPTIVGGEDAQPNAWPWMARLNFDYGATFGICGGSLIDRNWVLTAAHCVDNIPREDFPLENFTVILGDHDRTVGENTEQIFNVRKIIIHPEWETNDIDMALLLLNTPAVFTQQVSPISFVNDPAEEDLAVPGTIATVIGWGHTNPDRNVDSLARILQQVNLVITPNNECSDILDQWICTKPISGLMGICAGDSGGPLMVPDGNGNWKLAGIVSWNAYINNQCGSNFDAYTRISKFSLWINSQIGRIVFLPHIDNLSSPDLIVQDVQRNSSSVIVTIKNTGTRSSQYPFWVDLYVDPNPVPTAVNQIWEDGRSKKGIVWGVTASLEPGETLTLTNGDQYYYSELSKWPEELDVNAAIYVQVDSANEQTNYGNILELHELTSNGVYNNIYPLPTSAGSVSVSAPVSATIASSLSLPKRR